MNDRYLVITGGKENGSRGKVDDDVNIYDTKTESWFY